MNFLSDPEFPPVKMMAEVAAGMGVSESGMHAKSRQIRKMMGLWQFHPDWTLPSLLARNSLVWMLETTSGLVVDIRLRPRGEQVMAFKAGLIPFVPADAAEDPGVARPPRVAAHDHGAVTRSDGEPGDVIGRISPDAARGAT